MTEHRPPYQTQSPARPRIRYPGSRLETLVEALDDLAEFAPEAYPLRIAAIHEGLRAALHGEASAEKLAAYLLEQT